MKIQSRQSLVTLLMLIAVGISGISCTKQIMPQTYEKPGPPPSRILAERKLNQPPPLRTKEHVPIFVDWAGKSLVQERERARQAITEAREYNDVVSALIEEVDRSQKMNDYSRTLLVLAIIGEMKNELGAKYLLDFVHKPLPEKGTIIDGEIIERTLQEMLQAKAVDGLAYMRSPEWDAQVKRVIGSHPSRAVRAEAINAFMWNHGDSREAHRELSERVSKEDLILLDRVRRLSGDSAEVFNSKLEAFLKMHPQVIPPDPQKMNRPERQKVKKSKVFDELRPKF